MREEGASRAGSVTKVSFPGREEVKTRCPGRRAGLATDIDFSWASSLPRARGVKARWIPAPCQVPGRLRAGMKGGAPSPRRSGEVDGVVDGYAVLNGYAVLYSTCG